jgi:hypothetical protein
MMMLVFLTDPACEALEIGGTVDVVVARVPTSLSPPQVALFWRRRSTSSQARPYGSGSP